MRFIADHTKKKKALPDGLVRLRREFLWFPMGLLNDKNQWETRWLEYASWYQWYWDYKKMWLNASVWG